MKNKFLEEKLVDFFFKLAAFCIVLSLVDDKNTCLIVGIISFIVAVTMYLLSKREN